MSYCHNVCFSTPGLASDHKRYIVIAQNIISNLKVYIKI